MTTQTKKKTFTNTKPTYKKGVSKIQSEKDTENNPLLKIENNQFVMEVGNLIENPWIIINEGYENFDPKDKGSLDASRLDMLSEFLVILRSFEYVITARFKVTYIWPLWSHGEKTGDLSFEDLFSAIGHRLRMELFMRSPNFDEIDLMGIQYIYKIKYVTEEMIKERKTTKSKEKEENS